MTTQQHDPGRLDERLRNLGLVVDNGATLEMTLRDAFCSIIGNKYAAVIAAGQSVEWLILNCRAVLAAHREITGEHRANILAALDACMSANNRRTALLHGITTAGRATDGQLRTIRSVRGTFEPEIEICLPEDIFHVADALTEADLTLFRALRNAVSPEDMVVGGKLAWQQRRAAEAGSE
jgi:hypothetical protein